MADYFVRISLSRDRVSSRTLRRSPSGKACDRKIKASPKEMHRAASTNESGSELFEYPVTLKQDSPEAVRSLGIIGCMLVVISEGNRISNLIRLCMDLDLYCESPQRFHQLTVNVSH